MFPTEALALHIPNTIPLLQTEWKQIYIRDTSGQTNKLSLTEIMSILAE